MPIPSVRLAENADGPAIAALLKESGQIADGLTFENIKPFWLVAELPERGLVGCIQTCISRPIGRLEMLAVSKALTPGERGMTVKKLILDGSAVLRYHGADFVGGFIEFRLKGFKRALRKRGAGVIGSGNMMIRKIA